MTETRRGIETEALIALGLTFAVSLIFLHSPGTSDVPFWLDRRWLPRAERYGIIDGYTRTRDNYPPLSFVVVACVGKLAHHFAVAPLVIYKLALFAFLLASSAATYLATASLWGAAAMHLALTTNSMMHGYLDILFAPFLILTFHFLRNERLAAASLTFALAALMKYQPLILAPVLALHVAVRGVPPLDLRALGRHVALAIAPATALMLVARAIFGPWMFESLRAATGHSWLSANALNLNWLVATVLNPADPLAVRMESGFTWKLPRLIFYAALALCLWGYARSRRDAISCLVFSTLGYLSYFMFNHGVHENHLFPAAILGLLGALWEPRRLNYMAYWPLAAIINHLLFYGFTGEGFPYRRDLAGVDLTTLFAALNLIFYALSLRLSFARLCHENPPLPALEPAH